MVWIASCPCSVVCGFIPFRFYFPHNTCMYCTVVADHLQYSCLLGLLVPDTDGLSTYVQEPLKKGRRGCTGRDLNERTLATDNGR